ncbi:DUF1684 domain-containing protein [Larkinella knui]|uniref:DUF1684 domain-containing protein n=1 Tax=Larkinella knui TaxID=2025310 RepID=A0A3P1CB59_9BACT|nr:DUF1684 domain-containing protein [Larkinella knui]RRB10559.1 DUF1684 domain-containing protein [Larkinella knui]
MLFALVASLSGFSQTPYLQQIAAHREEYKADFLKSPKSPLKKEDFKKLSFYEPDSLYRVEATVQRTPTAEPFELPTYDGQKKTYVSYALLTFRLKGKTCRLTLYRSLQLARLPQYRDYLFLPFKDASNGRETYGGGRYMDLRVGDIKDGKIALDFNKAYNPYCAYSDGYACPIPPKENHLTLAVEAGEKQFANKE